MNVLLKPYYRFRKAFEILPLYWYNAKRFIKYSSSRDTEESFIGQITMAVHGIEKGLTMGDLRLGFGHDRLSKCLDDSERYLSLYGKGNIQIQHIANVVNDYNLLHKRAGFVLDEKLQGKIDRFLSKFDCDQNSQIQKSFTREEFFSKREADFASFAKSRHSCRNFDSKPLLVSKIDEAVALAQTSPSACNRQAARIYVIEGKETIAKILALHGGSRGFSEKIDKLVLVCGYLPCYHSNERDCVYTDCGIFTMNLAYALHYYGVGACILNWSAQNENDRKCRELINLPKEEVICTLIACGNVPEEFKTCNSGKKDLSSILHHIA